MELVRLYNHDHPTCAAGCGTTWMKRDGEILTEHGTMVMYHCERSHCNMLTVVARYNNG
jgi:hypothetical protein